MITNFRKFRAMKRILDSSILIVLFSTILTIKIGFSQVWFDLGVNGSAGTGLLTNPSLYSDSSFNVAPQIQSSVSFKVGINPTETDAVVIETGFFNRSYEIDQFDVPGLIPNQGYTQNINFSGIHSALLYRRTNESSFFEIGPMYTMNSNQRLNDNANVNNVNENFIKKNTFRIAAGIGGVVIGSERVTLVSGFRLIYDLSDLRDESAFGESFPYQSYNDQSLHRVLKAIDFQLSLELNISLGFLYRTQCGKRQLIFEW